MGVKPDISIVRTVHSRQAWQDTYRSASDSARQHLKPRLASIECQVLRCIG